MPSRDAKGNEEEGRRESFISLALTFWIRFRLFQGAENYVLQYAQHTCSLLVREFSGEEAYRHQHKLAPSNVCQIAHRDKTLFGHFKVHREESSWIDGIRKVFKEMWKLSQDALHSLSPARTISFTKHRKSRTNEKREKGVQESQGLFPRIVSVREIEKKTNERIKNCRFRVERKRLRIGEKKVISGLGRGSDWSLIAGLRFSDIGCHPLVWLRACSRENFQAIHFLALRKPRKLRSLFRSISSQTASTIINSNELKITANLFLFGFWPKSASKRNSRKMRWIVKKEDSGPVLGLNDSFHLSRKPPFVCGKASFKSFINRKLE